MSCSVGRRHSSDPALQWLWQCHRPVAAAPIWLLAWELPYTTSAALKKKKRERKKCRLSSHLCNPAGKSDLEAPVVLWLSRIRGPPSYAPIPCCIAATFSTTPGSHRLLVGVSLDHDWMCRMLQRCPKMELLIVSTRWTWSYLSSSREEVRPSSPHAPACPSTGWDLAETRAQGHSGLSVGAWALDLVLIQGTELSWAVSQPFWRASQKPKVWGRVDQRPEGPGLEPKTGRTKPYEWSQVSDEKGLDHTGDFRPEQLWKISQTAVDQLQGLFC